MARRRQRPQLFPDRTQDPGKDLFAYLFLLIMVFSFMLLMTTQDCRQALSGQKGPRKHGGDAKSTLAAVSSAKIGRIVKGDGSLAIAFEDSLYDPETDFERLERDGRISTVANDDGTESRLLYIEEDKGRKVLLTEYLNAFRHLSGQGVGVAFAEKVK